MTHWLRIKGDAAGWTTEADGSTKESDLNRTQLLFLALIRLSK